MVYFPVAVYFLVGLAVPLVLVGDGGEIVGVDEVGEANRGRVVVVDGIDVELLERGATEGCDNEFSNVVDESKAKDGLEYALDKIGAVFWARIANHEGCVGERHCKSFRVLRVCERGVFGGNYYLFGGFNSILFFSLSFFYYVFLKIKNGGHTDPPQFFILLRLRRRFRLCFRRKICLSYLFNARFHCLANSCALAVCFTYTGAFDDV